MESCGIMWDHMESYGIRWNQMESTNIYELNLPRTPVQSVTTPSSAELRQPQLNKAAKSNELEEKGDRNPKELLKSGSQNEITLRIILYKHA